MKILIFFVVFSILALSCRAVPPQILEHKKYAYLLGEKECTYGPSFWCKNLMNAGNCRATKHCIQTVWIHEQLPPDTSSVCDTCKQMVKQARDQLESNETQELIKEVFEGSCDLLRIKPIVEECDKIADNYIPDLIDTLASEMNPQVICSVAGLCNSVKVHQLLAEAGEQISVRSSEVSLRNQCRNCNILLDIVIKKFNTMSRDEFLERVLGVCRKFGSFSDGCSNIVVKNFGDIYSYLKRDLHAGDICLLSGECSTNFHKHEVEITPMSNIGYVPVGEKDDLPCELCEHLVNHLRDILVAQTTEAEFKQLLEGLCKQTGSFKDECLSYVDQYYEEIYNYLVKGLNATEACSVIGICPNGLDTKHFIAPLLPVETAQVVATLRSAPDRGYVPEEDVVKVISPKPVLRPEEMQLPIDLLVPPHAQLYNQQFCVFCEYFLHYVQTTITTPGVEAEIKKVVDEACEKLPRSVSQSCIEFVQAYEPALVALLAQEIDPSQLCPMIKACPSEDVRDVEIFIKAKSSAQCPLCLYAVTELEEMIKGKNTKDEIEKALEKICLNLPEHLRGECTDFINTYTDELVEMLVADLTPQEVCVYLKLCTDTTPVSKVGVVEIEFIGGDTNTNAIFDDTVNGQRVEPVGTGPQCILCEFVMKQIDDELKNKNTDDDIKKIVHGICRIMPGTVKTQCNNFVDEYADAIILLLQEALEPSEVCKMMKLCRIQDPLELAKEEVTKCGVCKSAIEILKTILKNPKVDQDFEHVLEKTCRAMPKDVKSVCETMVREHGIRMIDLVLNNTNNAHICQKIDMCESEDYFPVLD